MRKRLPGELVLARAPLFHSMFIETTSVVQLLRSGDCFSSYRCICKTVLGFAPYRVFTQEPELVTFPVAVEYRYLGLYIYFPVLPSLPSALQ